MIGKIGSSEVSAENPGLEKDKKKLMEQCREFESVLTGFMMHSMRETIQPADEPERGREIFEEMFDQQVSRELSQSRTGSLAATLYRSLEPLLAKSGQGTPSATPESTEAGMAAASIGRATVGKDEE